jgi:hypothetical protein
MKADQNLDCMAKIDQDIIWSKTDDWWIPVSAGILNKTIYSLELMLPRLHEFDYVLRTNLSTFVYFPNLLKRLESLPRKNCYFGPSFNADWIPGYGIVMSSDVAAKLVAGKDQLVGRTESADDFLIGDYLKEQGIRMIKNRRVEFIEKVEDWMRMKDNIPEDAFLFRIRIEEPGQRRDDAAEIEIHEKLFEKYYHH